MQHTNQRCTVHRKTHASSLLEIWAEVCFRIQWTSRVLRHLQTLHKSAHCMSSPKHSELIWFSLCEKCTRWVQGLTPIMRPCTRRVYFSHRENQISSLWKDRMISLMWQIFTCKDRLPLCSTCIRIVSLWSSRVPSQINVASTWSSQKRKTKKAANTRVQVFKIRTANPLLNNLESQQVDVCSLLDVAMIVRRFFSGHLIMLVGDCTPYRTLS
jgi:hypothetical protein